ncbi:hypothetical protein BCR33DRAFT_848060 [Rhizoclosmatium globosum]|uniref:Uncharacterized protein n=1 Tax=Rhizoclosmatium globosum TaxID=329046 RepID=A0A1Y2CQS3_9FUNG|nr:hypothetical protein BCR33DRAFT_848060 [Rhizoclosmatium globosum]|eukprot:ORY48705.1 hypothetical protein BCR33DRAFT_848060 [Rhizoclosmatium globosum]
MSENIDNQLILPGICFCSVMSFASLGFLAAVVREIVKHQVPKKRKQALWKYVATPFNISLIVMAFSQIILYASEAIILSWFFDTSQPQLRTISRAVRSCCISMFNLTYLYYSYVRTYPIIEQEFPTVVWPVWFLTMLASLVTIIPMTCRTVLIWSSYPKLFDIIYNASISMFGSLNIIDLVFLLTFIKHLHKTKTDGRTVDKHFTIISQYGIASIMVYSVLTGLDIIYVITYNEAYLLAVESMITFIFLILVAMKIALRKEKEKELSRRKSRVETARRQSMGGHTVRSQDTMVSEGTDGQGKTVISNTE